MEVTRRWHGDNIPFPLNFFLPSHMRRQQLARLRLIKGNEALEAGEEVEKEVSGGDEGKQKESRGPEQPHWDKRD